MAQPGKLRAPAATDSPDWTVQAADTVERVVGTIRDKTAMPLITVARAVVFGLVAGVMGVSALVLVAIGLVRALDAYVPQEVWSAHLIVGGIFTLAGGLLLRKAAAGREKR